MDKNIETIGVVEFDSKHSFYVSMNFAGLTPLYKLIDIKIIGNKYEDRELYEGIILK